MNLKIPLNEPQTEIVNRLMIKLGINSHDELLNRCLHLMQNLVAVRDEGYTEIIVRNPKLEKQRFLTVPGWRP
jgi:hypothetical protein